MRILVVSYLDVDPPMIAFPSRRLPSSEEIIEIVASREERLPFLDDFVKSCESVHFDRLDRERESARIASELEPVVRRYDDAPAAGGARHLVQMVSRAERRREVLKRHAQRMRA